MEVSEVRHLTSVRSNFGIADKRECLLHTISHENQPLSHAIIESYQGDCRRSKISV